MPAGTTNPTPSPASHVATLPPFDGSLVLWAVVGIILASGLVIILGRAVLAQKQSDQTGDSASSIVRSWIAISLVAGLLLFCGVAFAIDDSTLRSTLFGGLVTSVGAAVAFYFSSKSADQARQDVISAALGTTEVPDLVGKNIADARAAISETPLALVVSDSHAAGGSVVTHQSPAKGTSVRSGSKVTIESGKPAAKPAAPTARRPVR